MDVQRLELIGTEEGVEQTQVDPSGVGTMHRTIADAADTGGDRQRSHLLLDQMVMLPRNRHR